MSAALVPLNHQELIMGAATRARDFAANSKAEATIRAYRSCIQHWTAWCRERGLIALPALPTTVALYLADNASKYKVASLSLRMAAISACHKAAGYESPCLMRHNEVASVWSGIRRTYGVVQVGKSALLTDDIRHMIEGLPDTLRGLRDASLLLVGFASAMRRSELASLLVSDLEFCEEGLKLHIRRSKTDQEGKGAIVGICFGANPQTCPIRATKRWLTAAGIESGFVWRAVLKGGRLQKSRMAGDSIGLLVKRAAASIGLDTAKFAGHSLRAGFVTQASRAGVSESSIMRTTRHRSIAMVQRYCREVDVWRNNAGAKLGL